MKQTKNQSTYSFCRPTTDCQSRIHCLLEAVYLTVNSTRPSPVTVYPLQVKFESIIISNAIISNAQNSAFYTDCLATKWPISFIGHKVACFFYWPQSGLFLLLATKWPVSFIGHKVPYFFYWPQSGQCVCIVITSFIVFGHKVAHAFGVDITYTNTLHDDSPFCFNDFCQFCSSFCIVK